MKYGVNSRGNKIHYSEAIKGNNYICPYCFEKLIVRGGERPCFAHSKISGRTPIQRMCPEFHEAEGCKKIENEIDRIYIENGGVPLYLCNYGNRFELRAYFPQLSDKCFEELENKKSRIILKTNNKELSEYSISNLKFYTLYDIVDWIDIEIKPSTNNNEVRRKLLWGIRGIDINKDIYHAHNDGGYRVSLKGNICVGKTYRILSESNNIKSINGIEFRQAGSIRLNVRWREKEYFIFEMVIESYTEEAKEYIEAKGYKFKDQVSKIIPVWPPVKFEGNEIITESDKVWFYHTALDEKEYFNEISANQVSSSSKVRINTTNNILKISNLFSNNEKTVVLSSIDEIIGYNYSEIKYSINYRKNSFESSLENEIIFKDIEGKEIEFNEGMLTRKRPIFLESKISPDLRLMKGSFCKNSSFAYDQESNQYCIDKFDYTDMINLDFKALGNLFFNFEEKTELITEAGVDDLYSQLLRCREPYVLPKNNCKVLFYKIKNDLNKKNIDLYMLLNKWIYTRKIPRDAQKIIDINERMILSDKYRRVE